MGHHKVPALSRRCIWHMSTTQDLEDTVYSPCVKCGSQKNHWLFTAFSPDDNRRLRLFGHYCSKFTSRGPPSSPCSVYPPDWKRLAEDLATLGSVQLRQTLALWPLASRLPRERPLLETNGDILWTQQRSSGVRSERRRRTDLGIPTTQNSVRVAEGIPHTACRYCNCLGGDAYWFLVYNCIYYTLLQFSIFLN